MNETNSIIKKSNTLIDKARYELTLTQQRLILYTIAHINVSDTDFKDYDIPVTELIEKTGSSLWLYHELKKEAQNLIKKVFTIENMSEDGKKVATTMAWFSSVRYKEGSGTIQIEFSPKLKPYLLQLKERFTTYMLKYVLPMKSPYSIRVYELLIRFQDFNKRYFKLEEFKQLLMIENKATYHMYGNLKRYILQPAITEINKCTDLKITKFEEEKLRSRKVTGFTIHFIKKQVIDSELIQEQPSEEAKEPVNEHLETLYLNIPEQHQIPSVKSIISHYLEKDDDYIISNIKYTVERKPILFSAALAAALEKDLAKPTPIQEQPSEPTQEQPIPLQDQAQEPKLDQEIEAEEPVVPLLQEQLPEEAKECQSFESLPPEEKQKYIEKAKEFLKKEYRESNLYETSPVLIEQKAIDLFNQEKIARLESQGSEPPENL